MAVPYPRVAPVNADRGARGASIYEEEGVARLPARRDLGYLPHPQGHEPVLDGRFRADRESGRLQAFNHLDKADTFPVDHTVEEADVLHGRTITSWPSLRTDIRNAGGTWLDSTPIG
jgi:putative intracellular protease/amidase